ncbi:MAG: hypothetical protein EHM90_02520 [Chloroflexi bacterium]|nr:MAG: hypothetical protein EHM90_02520 [Chloroflexota bacterium]
MTERPRLSDALIKEALSRRAAGPSTPAELVIDVRAAVETIPQGLGWRWRVSPQPRLLPVLLTLLLLAAVLGYALIVGGAVVVPSSEWGAIAFVRATYGWGQQNGVSVEDRRIYTVAAAGGQPAPLAEVPGLEVPAFEGQLALRHGASGPAVQWSPDGTRLAFRVFNGAAGVYVMNRDGTELQQLVALPADDSSDGFALHTNREPMSAALSWVPDGTQIAFIYPFYSIRAPVFSVDTNTGEVRNITGEDPMRGASGSLAWSPDGSQIAFSRKIDTFSSSLLIVNADGTMERRLPLAEREETLLGRLAWSPNGALVAFMSIEVDPSNSGRTELVIADADGTGVRRLTSWGSIGCCQLVNPAGPVAWSPDGSRIAFPGEDGGIWITLADGSATWKVADGVSPAFSPDGSQLVFSRPTTPVPGSPSRIAEQHSIYVINADGTGLRWIADGEYPVWAQTPGGGD